MNIPITSENIAATHWHSLEPDAVLQQLGSQMEGLAATEAGERLGVYGPNLLRTAKPRGPLLRFATQFHNVLIYVLLAAAALTAALQHWVDTGVIIGVVIINAVIGYIQEGKAEKALAAIRQMLSQTAAVRRDGQWSDLPAEQLVPGDIVALQSGDKVPADLRLLNVKNLQIDEALLTGESVPASKHTAVSAVDAPLGDRRDMAYSGTLVTYGQARGVVTGTGNHTEIGRISDMLAQIQPLTTPLLRQMAVFGHRLTAGILSLGALTVAFGVAVHNYPLADMLLAAVGLSVAAIPEGLPAIMTITLAIGVQRMVHRNAIIRRLPAVETLGALSVVCSDKTGTLTRNEMTVQAVTTADAELDISGIGYSPVGELLLKEQPVLARDFPAVHELARASILCNEASLIPPIPPANDDQWRIQGDPTEAALLSFGVKCGLDISFTHDSCPRTDVIPFESEHRFMASLHHDHEGHGFIYVKGAPERILEMCQNQRTTNGERELELQYWHRQLNALAGRGLRLLAIATKPAAEQQRELTFADIDSGLTFLGVVGLIDPPRAEAIRAVQQCHAAGIRVKMITGDHAKTAVAIGKQLGIGDGSTVLTGPEIDTMDAEQLSAKVAGIDVFARTSPEHKLQLVTALQANKQVVAMTGDGVNDAPALRRADVGVAMGRKGTEVAKEASEMVLTDDNFASIAHAIEEGRTVYDNLKKAILFILPTNGGEALIIVTAIVLGQQLPITAVQILWVNMITAVTLALALAFEPAERGVMARPPRDSSESILSRMVLSRIAYVAAIIVTGTFGLYQWALNSGISIEYARTVAVNTLVVYEIFYLFNARYIRASAFHWQAILSNRYAWIAIAVLVFFQLLFTYAAPMQSLFQTAAITAKDWLMIVSATIPIFFLVEFEKWILRLREAKRLAQNSFD